MSHVSHSLDLLVVYLSTQMILLRVGEDCSPVSFLHTISCGESLVYPEMVVGSCTSKVLNDLTQENACLKECDIAGLASASGGTKCELS